MSDNAIDTIANENQLLRELLADERANVRKLSDEIERLREVIDQIKGVANDNKSASCDQGMALSFVHMVADKALSSGSRARSDGPMTPLPSRSGPAEDR